MSRLLGSAHGTIGEFFIPRKAIASVSIVSTGVTSVETHEIVRSHIEKGSLDREARCRLRGHQIIDVSMAMKVLKKQIRP